MNLRLNIVICEQLYKNDVETLMYKGLDSDQNIFEALVKNMFIK